jgi:hypothetical protein
LCELDPVYCDRILQRWEIFAKDDAELVACGLRDREASDDESYEEQAGEGREACQSSASDLPPIAVRRPVPIVGPSSARSHKADPTSQDDSFGSPHLRHARSLRG